MARQDGVGSLNSPQMKTKGKRRKKAQVDQNRENEGRKVGREEERKEGIRENERTPRLSYQYEHCHLQTMALWLLTRAD